MSNTKEQITSIEQFISVNFNPEHHHEDLPSEMRFINSAIKHLQAKGFEIKGVHTGEDFEPTDSRFEALDHIFSVDESHLCIEKDGKKLSIYIVIGNFDGTAFADYPDYDEIDSAIDNAGKTHYPDLF